MAALALLLLVAWAAPATCIAAEGLSPPWWVTYDMMQAALRSDRCLNVSALEPVPHKPEFGLNITVCRAASADKLAGIATFLTQQYDFGGQLFSSKVLDSNGRVVRPTHVRDGEHAMKLAGAALQGNRYFERTAVSSPLPCIDFYWVVFKPLIVQIWVDNLGDLYGNINLLAADLFARVFHLEEFGVRATTLKFEAPDSQLEAQPCHEGGSEGSSGSSVETSERPRLQQRQQQQQEQQAAEQEERRHAALVAALRQRWQEQQLLRQVAPSESAAPGSTQRHAAAAGPGAAALPNGSAASGSCWRAAAQCWALRLAKRMGGDAAVLKAQRWVL